MDFGAELQLIISSAILLAVIILIIIQSRILKVLSKKSEVLNEFESITNNVNHEEVSGGLEDFQKGTTSGETRLIGIDNEEEVAVIMAVVSKASRIPLSGLKINYIKRIDV